jgi:hypothetical protein
MKILIKQANSHSCHKENPSGFQVPYIATFFSRRYGHNTSNSDIGVCAYGNLN